MPLDPDSLRVELIYDRSGTTEPAGGQQAGTPATSIRVTHLPSGVVAQVGGDLARTQHRQRAIAFEMIEWALLAAPN